MLRSFFWRGTELKTSGAKVSWQDVRAPKDWNKVAMCSHLWALSQKANLLWVKWVHSHIIKEHLMLLLGISGRYSSLGARFSLG